MARGMMKLSLDAHFAYDPVFSKMAIVITCVIMDNVHYTVFGQVESNMTTFTKVQKPSLIIEYGNAKGRKLLFVCVFHSPKQ
jgi:hypothetical protein